MRNSKKLIVILIVSLLIALIGFSLDNSERKSSVFTSIFEIFMFTLCLFAILSVNYFALSLCFKIIKKGFANKN